MDYFLLLKNRRNVRQDDVANFNWLQKVMDFKSIPFIVAKKTLIFLMTYHIIM